MKEKGKKISLNLLQDKLSHCFVAFSFPLYLCFYLVILNVKRFK